MSYAHCRVSVKDMIQYRGGATEDRRPEHDNNAELIIAKNISV